FLLRLTPSHSFALSLHDALPILLRVQLIERRAGVDVVAFGLLRMRLREEHRARPEVVAADLGQRERLGVVDVAVADDRHVLAERDRKSTRLNSSHVSISYAVFCL